MRAARLPEALESAAARSRRGSAASAILDARPGAAAARALADAIAAGPRMTAQRQAMQGWSAAAETRFAGADVAQLVDYPKDSKGTIKKQVKVQNEAGTKWIKVDPKVLQDQILQTARAAQKKGDKAEGGFRLGSYVLDEAGGLTRDPAHDNEAHGMPALPKTFDKDALDTDVKPYVRAVLKEAGQLKYIEKNPRAIFDTHEVVVDVDCQFDRTGNVGFHKDSRGTTAFVNLTFQNDEKMQGTDFYEDTTGDPGLEKALPNEVQKDITKRRNKFHGKDTIESKKLPKWGRMSFSDPSLYHSTPRMGHRTAATGQETTEDKRQDLTRILSKDDLQKATSANLNYWHPVLIEPYNRHGREAASSRTPDEQFALASAAVDRRRRVSLDLDRKKTKQTWLDDQGTKTRTFIRTWVRFVPKAKAKETAKENILVEKRTADTVSGETL